MQRERVWLPPVLQEQQLGLPIGSVDRGLVGVSSSEDQSPHNGVWTNFDVWIQVNSLWLNTELAIELASLDGVTEVQRKRVQDMELPRQQRGRTDTVPGGSVGVFSGLLFSVRGRQASKARVTATWASPEGVRDPIDLPPGKFQLHAWGSDGGYGDRNTRLVSDGFASREQWQEFTADIPAGSTVIFPTRADGGRQYITDVVHRTDDAVVRTVLLETVNVATGAVTTRFQYLVGGTLPTFEHHFGTPLRSDRGDLWRVTLSGDAGAHLFNAEGFHE